MNANFGDYRLPEIFWSKVKLNEETGCWNWIARLDKDGYGAWRSRAFRHLGDRVHRVSYSLLVGEIPSGLVIDHLCRTRNCVNPEHLEPVTTRENTDRGVNYIAENRAKTHCPKGHEYAGDNLVIKRTKQGEARICRTCRNEQALAAFYEKRWNPNGAGAPALRTHCKQGHEFSEENTHTITNKHGGITRVCRTCGRESKRRQAEAKRLERDGRQRSTSIPV